MRRQEKIVDHLNEHLKSNEKSRLKTTLIETEKSL